MTDTPARALVRHILTVTGAAALGAKVTSKDHTADVPWRCVFVLRPTLRKKFDTRKRQVEVRAAGYSTTGDGAPLRYAALKRGGGQILIARFETLPGGLVEARRLVWRGGTRGWHDDTLTRLIAAAARAEGVIPHHSREIVGYRDVVRNGSWLRRPVMGPAKVWAWSAPLGTFDPAALN